LYKMLRLRVTADAERMLWVEGIFEQTFSVDNRISMRAYAQSGRPGSSVVPERWGA
jgi:hypothetical protein